MNRCRVPYNHLLDYFEGRADRALQAQLDAHLAQGCSQCEGRLAQIEKTLSALRQTDFVAMSDAAMQRAYQLYRERFRKPERLSLLARLVFDSRSTSALVGARGQEETSRQLLYKTDGYDIDLWQELEEAGVWYLIGQIVPQQGESVRVAASAALIAANQSRFDGDLVGEEFHLKAVPPGLYRLEIELEEAAITLPDVLVGVPDA